MVEIAGPLVREAARLSDAAYQNAPIDQATGWENVGEGVVVTSAQIGSRVFTQAAHFYKGNVDGQATLVIAIRGSDEPGLFGTQHTS